MRREIPSIRPGAPRGSFGPTTVVDGSVHFRRLVTKGDYGFSSSVPARSSEYPITVHECFRGPL